MKSSAPSYHNKASRTKKVETNLPENPMNRKSMTKS